MDLPQRLVSCHTTSCWGLVGAAICCSPIMRTRCEMLALRVGTTAFWGLVIWQVIFDTTSGRASVSHLMLLLGITVIV